MSIRLKYILPFVFFFGSLFYLTAQEPAYIQRLSWTGQYSLRYEVVIQLIEEGNNGNIIYHDHIRQITGENFIDVTLLTGQYRFRVIPYDVLDRPSNASGWMYFQVRRLAHETAESRQPEVTLELEPETIVVLETQPEPERQIKQEDQTEKEAKPKIERPLTQIRINAAWLPLLGVTENYYNGLLIHSGILRLSLTLNIPDNVYVGPEITASYRLFDGEQFVDMGFILLTLIGFPNEAVTAGVRFGVESEVYPDAFTYINVVFGTSFHINIEWLSLEFGIEYVHSFSNDRPAGIIRPWVGIGIKLK